MVEPQHVVQCALFEQVEVLVVANAEGDAGVHLRALEHRRPLLEVAHLDAEGLAIRAIHAARRQRQEAQLFTARLRVLAINPTHTAGIWNPITRQCLRVACWVLSEDVRMALTGG